MTPPSEITTSLRAQAHAAGFDAVRVTTPYAIPQAAVRLQQFLGERRHGTMTWLAEGTAKRAEPSVLWPQTRSIIMLGMSYAPIEDPLSALAQRSRGAISVYAKGKDYHDIVKTRLKRVAGWLVAQTAAQVKVFVDTAPVMEKPLAASAGLGWQGKHTNLVSREHGSWLFLGSIFTDAALTPDEPERDRCGSCTRCLDICPTAAFPAPYQLDARRCISYLTIEYKGHIAAEFRVAMGNRIFGCDDCLAVCPWNKFAHAAREQRFHARADVDNPDLASLLALDEPGFRARFAGMPVKRAGYAAFLRNVLIAAGNSADAALTAAVEARLHDPHAIIRAMAVWALRRLCPSDRFDALRVLRLSDEIDPAVRAEWLHDNREQGRA